MVLNLYEALLAQLAAAHTFDVPRCAEVIESTLVEVNAKTGLPDRLAQWLHDYPKQLPPDALFAEQPRLIVDLSISGNGTSELKVAALNVDHAMTIK
jgi:hypothetical protein